MKRIVVFYYTQSGQALSVAMNICKPLEDASNEHGKEFDVVFKEIKSCQKYPFPWTKYEFFDSFPETRLGQPPSGIESIDFSDVQDAELVIVVGQSWYLSPSLPIQSFFEDENVKTYLHSRNVIFVNACRNMWLMTKKRIKEYVSEVGANMVGHIVLQDGAPNLVSVVTIVRWLIEGRKEATRWFPNAGISEENIENASRFGDVIKQHLRTDDLTELQNSLLRAGAIHYKPSIMFMEKAGHRMFGLWAKFIRRKGEFRDKRRKNRVFAFYYYLLFVLFIVSPFGQLFFFLTYPLQNVPGNKQKDIHI